MNLGKLRSLTQQYLECSETTFTANFPQFVKLCEEDIYRQVQLPDLVVTASSTFTAGSPFLPMPPDFLSAYYVAVIVNGEYQMLLSKDHSYIREVYPNPATLGTPRFFAVYDENALIVGPTPSQNFPAELNYFLYPPSLADGADDGTNWISENAENALLYGTIMNGYIYLKGDQDVIKQYSDQYTQALASLKIIAEGRDRKDSYRSSDRRLPV